MEFLDTTLKRMIHGSELFMNFLRIKAAAKKHRQEKRKKSHMMGENTCKKI